MPSSTITIKVNGQWNGSELEKAAQALGNFGNQAKSAGSLYTSSAQRIAVQTASLASSVTSSMAKSGTEYVKLGQSIEQVGQKMSAVGQSLTAHVTMPMLAVGTYAGAMAVQYDTAMANVRKVTDMTESQLEALGDSALELSKTQPVTAEQILNIEALGAQLGVADTALESFAQVVSGLDIATNLNSEQAAMQLAQFANITKMSETEYQNFGSTLVALGNNLATTEKDIMNMGMRLAAAGDIAGMTDAEILGLSGAMSSLGIRAEAGGSAMTTIMSKISKAAANGGSDLEAFASVAGMTADEFSAAWSNDPMTALTALLDGIKRLDDSGQDMNVTLSELGINEIRQSDAMRRLASNTDLLKESVDLATGAWEENTALTDEVSQRNESMASRLQVLKNRVDAIAIQVGGPLVEALIDVLTAGQPVIDLAADLAQQFADLDEGTQQTVIATAALVAGMGPLTSTLGGVVQGVGKAVQSYGHLKQNIAVLGDALNTLDGANVRNYKSTDTLAGKIGLAGNKAVSAAGSVDLYVDVWEKNYAANKKVQSSGEKIVSLLKQQEGASKKTSAQIAKQVTALAQEGAEAQNTANKTRTLLDVWEGSVDRSSAAGKAALEYAEGLKEASEKAVPAAQNTTKLQNVLGTVKGAASTAASGIAGFISSFGPMVAVAAAVAAVGYVITDIATRSAEAAERQNLLAEAGRTFGEISESAAAGAQSQAEGISDLGAAVDDTLQGLADLNRQAQETMDEFYVSSATLDAYTSTIEELAGKSGLTATEQERLKVAVAGYNEITGQSVEVTDAANGELSTSTEELLKNADAWKKNAESQAYPQLAVEYTKKQVEAQLELARANDEVAQAQQDYNDMVDYLMSKGYSEEQAKTAASVTSTGEALDDAKQKASDAALALDSATQSLSDIEVQAALTAGTLGEELSTAVSNLPSEFQAAGVEMATSLSSGIESGAINAQQAASYVTQAIGGVVSTLPPEMQQKGMEAAQSLASSIGSGEISVEQAVLVLKAAASGEVSTLPAELMPYGQQAAEALGSGMSLNSALAGQGAQALKDAANSAVGPLPSEFATVGTTSGTSLATGLAAQAPSVQTSGQTLNDSANAGVASLPSDLGSTGSTGGAALASNLGANRGSVQGSAQTLASAAQAGVAGTPGALANAGSSAGGNFASGIGSAQGATIGSAGSLASAAARMASVGDTWSWGNELGNNFAAGVRSAIGAVRSAASAVAGAVSSLLHFTEPDEGPLVGINQSGYEMAQNYANAMMRGVPLVSRASEALASAASFSPVAGVAPASAGSRAAASPVVNNYTLYLDGSRQGNVTRQVMDAVQTIFDEFNLTSDMGVM